MAEPGLYHKVSVPQHMGDLLEGKAKKLSQAEYAELDGTVWRMLDLRILPLITGFFLLAFLDRTNIANARVAGLQKSLYISNYQFTVALTLTYISLIISELPSALLLKHIGPDLMLPIMATLWGVVSATQGLVNNYTQLLVCRFLLGLLEGGIFPSIIIYLSFFYPRRMLQLRIAIYFVSASLSGAFSGLLAAAIDQMDGKGGKPGWAWIFILEGTLTSLFGVISFFLLPCSPEKAHFFTERERAFVISSLKQASSISEDDDKDRFSWIEVIRAAQSPHVWLLAVVFFFSGTMLLGLAYFEPTIVAGLGYTGNQAQLFSVPPFAAAFVSAIISAVVSDRYQCRGYVVIFFSLFSMIGFTMFYASKSHHVRYASLFFSVVGAYCAPPAHVTWLANNSAPHARRATAVAVGFMMTQLGGILATWMLGLISPAPDYRSATTMFVGMSIGMAVVAAVNLGYLRRENRKKAERRAEMGVSKGKEEEVLGDRSAWFVYSL